MTKVVWRVAWISVNDSGVSEPVDSPDEAAAMAQRKMRADFRCVITITPHEVPV